VDGCLRRRHRQLETRVGALVPRNYEARSNEGLLPTRHRLRQEPLIQKTGEYYMVDLTAEEKSLLCDVLDIEIEAFDDVMQDPAADLPESWDELLEATGSYGEILQKLRGIRKKVTDNE